MQPKSFFYVAAGVFLLVAAYAMGASSVQGQAAVMESSNVVEFVGIADAYGDFTLLTSSGDAYQLHNNVWTYIPSPVGTISVEQTNIGQVKAKYR